LQEHGSVLLSVGGRGALLSPRASCLRWILVFLAVAQCLLSPATGRADGRTAFLIERLKYPPGNGLSDDPRVRTSAALALGASNDDAAVQPLCDALGDPSELVRAASAAAMKRLAKAAALPCLQNRIGSESNPAAKNQMQQTIDALNAANGGGGGGGAPPSVAGAKYYVALSRITNNSGRPQSDVDAIVLPAIKGKLSALGTYQLAPAGENPTAARAAMGQRNLKGYYLSIVLDKFDYSGGNLKVTIKLAVFTYPGKDLRGEVPASASQSGISPGDKSSEDALMNALAANVIERFAATFP